MASVTVTTDNDLLMAAETGKKTGGFLGRFHRRFGPTKTGLLSDQ